MNTSILNELSLKMQEEREKNNILDMEEFHRQVEGEYENIEYVKGSTIRVWDNHETCSYPMHWHHAMEIIMAVENIYTVTIRHQDYCINPGEILIIPPGELHQLTAPPSGKRIILLFNFTEISSLPGFSSILPLLTQPIYITPDTYPEIHDIMVEFLCEIREEYFANEPLRDLAICSQLVRLFCALGRDHFARSTNNAYSTAYKQKDFIEKFNTVLNYIDAHYMEDITLEKAASVAGFSKFHFTRLFKQYSQQNFYDYLCFKRIKAAEVLLTRPNLSITEVSLQSGFSSISTFNRTFKKIEGCTPTEYRNLYTESKML